MGHEFGTKLLLNRKIRPLKFLKTLSAYGSDISAMTKTVNFLKDQHEWRAKSGERLNGGVLFGG